MGLTKKTADRWRCDDAFHDEIVADLRENAENDSPCDRAAAVLEEVARPRGVTRLELLVAGLLESLMSLSSDEIQLLFWRSCAKAGLWDRATDRPTKAGAELLRRVREAKVQKDVVTPDEDR